MAKLEILPPAPDLSGLKNYEKQLKYALMLKKRHLEKQVAGNLRISRKGNYSQFYLVTDKKAKNGTYIPVENKTTAEQIARRDYDIKMLKLFEQLIPALEKFLKKWEKLNPWQVYEKLSTARKLLVEPDILPNGQYARQWLSKKYEGRGFYAGDHEYFTTGGLRVRSKSEIIIAETLSKAGVPFRYEFPVEVNGRTMHPDFYCLDLATRNEIIWEHFGMMSDSEYAENAAGKLELYSKAGWILGKNLIVTMETAGCPLSQASVRKLVNAYFA